jgi:hypothetical protein
MVKLRGSPEGVLMDGSQVPPEERGWGLGEVCKLPEPTVPYCHDQVGGHQREGQQDEIPNHGVEPIELNVGIGWTNYFGSACLNNSSNRQILNCCLLNLGTEEGTFVSGGGSQLQGAEG